MLGMLIQGMSQGEGGDPAEGDRDLDPAVVHQRDVFDQGQARPQKLCLRAMQRHQASSSSLVPSSRSPTPRTMPVFT